MAIIISNTNFETVINSTINIKYSYLFPALIFYMSSFFVRALRWQFILFPIKAVSYSISYRIIIIGWMTNNILPARIGEIVRAYLIGKKEKISKTSSLATIVLERVFDGITLLIILLIFSISLPLPNLIKDIVIFSSCLFFIALSALLSLRFFGSRMARFLHVIPERFQKKILIHFDNFNSGLRVLSLNGIAFLKLVVYSIVIWLLEGSMYYFVLESFGLNLDFYVAFFLLAVVNLGILVPAAPGYIGTFQFFSIMALSIFGIDKNTGFSVSIVLHALQYFPITFLGLYYLGKEGIKLSNIARVKQ